MKEAFTVEPEVVYSPIALPSVTKRFEPEIAIAIGPLNPEISEALGF